MLGPFDYILLVTSFALEVSVVSCALYRKAFFRYFFLNLYMFCIALFEIGGSVCLKRYGVHSGQYYFFYYYTDALLTTVMLFVVIQFYQQVFAEMNVRRYIRGTASILIALTALFSYLVVRENRNHLTVQFVVEFGQNTYFVGVVLTYLLWGAGLKLRETRTRLVQLILALGIYFSAAAATYALRHLFPNLVDPILRWLPPVIGTWLPLAWTYTFVKVPEESRLEPGYLTTTRLALKTR
jgi:hypothetical protein